MPAPGTDIVDGQHGLTDVALNLRPRLGHPPARSDRVEATGHQPAHPDMAMHSRHRPEWIVIHTGTIPDQCDRQT